MSKRIRFAVFALPVAVLAFLAFSASAMAGNGENGMSTAQDPQTANIPYLAWAGNQVRIAKCLGQQELVEDHGMSVEQAQQILTPGALLRASWTVEDWSGVDENNAGPAFLNAPNRDTIAYLDGQGRLCFSVHVSSLKPGMAVIKGAARIDLAGMTPGLDILGKHQFLVIWMRSQAPVIREVANADFPDLDLGDPLGDGIFNPLFKNGLVQIDVKGTFPLGNDFAGIDPDNSITLPDDWAALAGWFGVDDYAANGGRPGSGANRWDIHDDNATSTNHAGANSCTPRAGTVDAVDNCYLIAPGVAGDETGPFSHYFGYSSGFTVGPFDPVRDLDTFLGDNKLDAWDAPMPALRVDVRIAAGGIGSLEKADKDDIYVRDQSVPDNTPHNLYAPFYKAYVPAAGPSFAFSDRSGVAGAFVSNNFPGYQNSGVYDYYDLVGNWMEDPTRGDDTVICRDELGNPRPNIEGYDHVAVYTDEHGQAFVTYNPNTGFRWNADSNGRCDLVPGPLGSAAITAEALYPDQPVLWDQASKVSNMLTKTVNSLASKTLSCVPKGFNESFCVERILDIQGRPVAGALVRFSRTPLGNIEPDAALHGGFDTRGQILVDDNGPLWVDVRTNSLGQAGVVVTESLNICVDVKTENMGTRMSDQNPGVKRFFLVNPTTGGTTTCGAPTGGTPGGNTGGGSTGTPTGNTGGGSTGGLAAAPVTAAVVSLAGSPVPAANTVIAKAQAKAAVAKLVSARLLVKKGNRYLVLRLKSPLKTAKVKVSLVGKNGKVSKVLIRKIATNRYVTVPNLKLNKTVKQVRVSVVA
jgi:hypothetical protein